MPTLKTVEPSKKTGRVLWYDRRDSHGIIVDADDNEFYVDSSVLLAGLRHLDGHDEVTFNHRIMGNTPCAYNVELLPGGEHADCGAEKCQQCCQHDERDHGICLACEHEEDAGADVDRAMAYHEGDR